MKVKFTLSIGYVQGRREEVMEYPDDEPPPTDKQIQADYDQWCANHMDGCWERLD